jgi:hypothetical protein
MNPTGRNNPASVIAEQIRSVCGRRVLLDSKLATLYGVRTKALNQAMRRNPDRFPADFLFQLRKDEATASR